MNVLFGRLFQLAIAQPRAGVQLSGQIQFPRAQRMTIRTESALRCSLGR